MNMDSVNFKYESSYNLRDDIVIFSNISDLSGKSDTVIPCALAIMSCSGGRVRMLVNDNAVEFGERQLLICKYNDKLSNVELSPDCKCTVIGFSERIRKDSMTEAHLWNKVVHLWANPVLTITDSLQRTLEYYRGLLEIKLGEELTVYNLEIIHAIVKAVLYELLQQVEECTETEMNFLLTRKEVLCKNFIQLVSTTRVKPRNLTWYANQLCVTPKYLTSVCKQVTGKSAFCVINEYVLKDIRHLLKNSSKSVKEIADHLGFTNISFFGKYVKQHTGFSPMKLRTSLRKG